MRQELRAPVPVGGEVNERHTWGPWTQVTECGAVRECGYCPAQEAASFMTMCQFVFFRDTELRGW